MVDCIIIGTGIAGVSAALSLQALRVNFMLMGDGDISPKTGSAERISNYPALPNVSGEDFRRALKNQLGGAGISITQKRVTGVYPSGDFYTVLCGNEVYETKTVILATGVEAVKPLKGEKEFLGRGVSYCATCDGALYKGKKIAVVCTEKSYEHEIELLASYADTVSLCALYKGAAVRKKNVELVAGMPLEIAGKARVEKLVFADKTLHVDGVFLLKSAAPPSALLYGLKTEGELIAVNRAGETNLKGVFAAGDCTGRPFQYAKAAGEGNVCAHSVRDYLANSGGGK